MRSDSPSVADWSKSSFGRYGFDHRDRNVGSGQQFGAAEHEGAAADDDEVERLLDSTVRKVPRGAGVAVVATVLALWLSSTFGKSISGNLADTSVAENMLDVVVGRKMDLPPAVLSTYKIDQIIVQISKPDGTEDSTRHSTIYEDIQIVSSGMHLKPEALSRAIYFEKGEKYSYTAYQNTISRLNNLGVFSYVRVSVKQSDTDSLLNQVDVTIDLTMAQNINLDIQADVVTKSTGYAGPHLLAGVSNNNTFKGAEKVSFGLTGGMEWQWGNKSGSELGTFSYDIGLATGITLPQRLIPQSWKSEKPLMVQQTSLNLDFNLLNRIAYYRMFSSRMNVNYTWGKTRKIQYSVSPLYLNSVTLLETTPEFDSVVNDNIYIRKSFEQQFIFGTRYGFTYDNTHLIRPRNVFFQTGLNLSGNLFDLIAGIG